MKTAIACSLALVVLPPCANPQSDALPTADGYRGIWYFNQPSNDAFAYKYSGVATYPQQQSPIAIYAPTVDKTFFCYGGTVPGKQELLRMVSYYDHRTGRVPRPVILLNKQTEDARDNPVLSIDGDGYLWIFSNSHGRARPAYIHRSRAPYDIAAFDLIATTNFSYGHPWHHPGKGCLFLHTLYENRGRSLYWSTSESGREWTVPSLLARAGLDHYQITAHQGDRTATAFNFHPDPGGLNARTNLYCLETRDMGQTWTTVAGVPAHIPLRRPTHPALVHDYQAEGKLVYLKEVAFARTGDPVILYLTSKGYASGPTNGPRIWHTAR